MQNLIDQARELMQWAEKYGIDEISLSNGGQTIQFSRNGGIQQVAPISAPASVVMPQSSAAFNEQPVHVSSAETFADTKKITSPMVGTFYRAPSPEAPPFKSVGDKVSVGDTVCIVEAMKIMNQLKSTHDGILRKILVNNAEVVTKGQVLMEIS